MPDNPLTITVRKRTEVLYEGQVKSVSGVNKKGPFDILPQHGNFISIIDGELTIREINGGVRKIPVRDAVLRVVGNQITVFLGFKK